MQKANSAFEGNTPEALLLRIAAGDWNAESILVETYYRGLLFVINRKAKNLSLAEDIVQDTFIVVLQKARENGIHNPAALSSFIRQTGINILLSHYRKESRRDTHGVDDIDIHAPDDGLDISRVLYSQQAAELTCQVIDELNVTRDKDVLRDFFVYDKSKSQICDELDLKPEHFDRVLFRARQRLKQLIQHKLGSDVFNRSNVLMLAILVGSIVYSSSNENYLSAQMRGDVNIKHYNSETPKTSRRYIPLEVTVHQHRIDY